jgi:hypothetical protein
MANGDEDNITKIPGGEIPGKISEKIGASLNINLR